MIFDASAGGRRVRVEVQQRDGGYVVRIGDQPERCLDVCEAGRREFLSVLVDGRSYDLGLERRADGYRVVFADDSIDVQLHDAARDGDAAARALGAGGPARVTAPMPGKLVGLLVAVGDEVVAGQGLVVIEAMKMENELRAPRAGVVTELPALAGQTVETGALLVVLE